MSTADSVPATKPQPVLIAFGAMAGLTFIVGGLGALDILPVKVVGLLALVVAGINVALGYIVRGQVVPLADTAALVNEDRRLVAGPAAAVVTGRPVEVVRDLGAATPPTDGAYEGEGPQGLT